MPSPFDLTALIARYKAKTAKSGSPTTPVNELSFAGETVALGFVLENFDERLIVLEGGTPTIPTPVITSFTPTTGAPGDTITVIGTGLSGATLAKVGATAGDITANTATLLAFTVGAGSASGVVSITTPGGTATGASFTVPTTAPAAPSAPDVDDAANTFSAALVPGYSTLAAYFYSLDGGGSYTSATNGGTIAGGRITIPVGNLAKDVGDVRLRVGTTGAAASNATVYTVNATVAYKLWTAGNSLTASTWPTILSQRLGVTARTTADDGTTLAQGGRTLEQIASPQNLQALIDSYDPSVPCLVTIQEQINSLRQYYVDNAQFQKATHYYTLLVDTVKKLTDVGFKVAVLTGTPVTVDTTFFPNAPDINPDSLLISAAIRGRVTGGTGQAPTFGANDVIDLSRNSLVAGYGSAAFGQDAGYSSFNPNLYQNWAAPEHDGTHPNPTGPVNDNIAHMVQDWVNYTVYSTPIPDPSMYGQEAPAGVPMTFDAITYGNPTIVGNTVSANQASVRSFDQFTGAGGDASKAYRGAFSFEVPNPQGMGFIGPTWYQPTSDAAPGWVAKGSSGYFNNNGTITMYRNEVSGAVYPNKFYTNTKVVFKLYDSPTLGAYVELYISGALLDTAPIQFPCWAGLWVTNAGNGAAFRNLYIDVAP
jgi:hypothetical protein